jgi:hypothetical protein
MNDHLDTASSPQAPAAKASGRRRFLGAGGSAIPVVLTLASSPALATGVSCMSPSRSMSRHLSANLRPDQGLCNGQSPGNYGQQTDPNSPAYSWPASPGPNTRFHSVFPGSRFLNRTFLEVLNLNDPSLDPSNVARHLAAAYLNCVRGLIPANVLTTTGVLAIYSSWNSTLTYTPFAGATPWSGADIVNYLKTNRIVL